jgi:hypothetical protein
MQVLGPAIQAQNQNTAARLQFQRDATLGQHLGMDGQPVGPGMSFDSLRVPMEDRVAKERATFGGQSFTAGDRTMPTAAAMSATMPPPQSFGITNPVPGPPPAPAYGSPVYRAQNPQWNMFQQQAYSTMGGAPYRRLF